MPSAVASWPAPASSPPMDDAEFSRGVGLPQRRSGVAARRGCNRLLVAAVRTRKRDAGAVNFKACATAGTHE